MNDPVLQPDIRLVDTAGIDNQRVGDDGIDRAISTRYLGLAHAIPDHLAATEFDLITIVGEVTFNLDKQLCIRQPDLVARGRAVHVSIDFP